MTDFHDTVLEVIARGRDLTLATLMDDGAPHATVVSYASDGLAVYVGCSPQSLKAHNLARDARIAAAITLPYGSWNEIRGLSLIGRARRLDGQGEFERADVLFLEKFDEMAQYVSTGETAIELFELVAERVSLLDYRQGFGHTEHGKVVRADGRTRIVRSA